MVVQQFDSRGIQRLLHIHGTWSRLVLDSLGHTMRRVRMSRCITAKYQNRTRIQQYNTDTKQMLNKAEVMNAKSGLKLNAVN
jgi:hypothetical protein